MRKREILVPEFYLEIVIKDQMSKAEIEKKVEQALGLTFFQIGREILRKLTR
jgi:hypothetical protein